jgi:hypothetical protein
MDKDSQPEINGWTSRALDLLKDRVDAIRSDLNALMGRSATSDPPKAGEPRIAGIGLTTWIAIFATIIVPLIGTAALVILHNP